MEFADYVKEIFDENKYRLARSIEYTKTHPWDAPFTQDLPSALKKVIDKLESAPLKARYD